MFHNLYLPWSKELNISSGSAPSCSKLLKDLSTNFIKESNSLIFIEIPAQTNAKRPKSLSKSIFLDSRYPAAYSKQSAASFKSSLFFNIPSLLNE